ncbi:FACT complex subunit SSRP1-like [Hylaeus volcanicus]|uniref:FACT complex subunit SSRP1-like n=1 Tax=Hylaeus volcanicus TaxID=313075 RepID=UPI0023B7BE25|nr:FACT complex subunit SSRP1-like [Hylaeus volcanicus]
MKSNVETNTGCLTYNNIRSNGLGDLGQFRTVGEKFGWRLRKPVAGVDASSRPTTQLDGRQVASVHWICLASREYGLKIVMKNLDKFYFSGFKITDYEPLKTHIQKYWSCTLEKGKWCSTGWHWGTHTIDKNSFTFQVNDCDAFDIPRDRISHVSVAKGNVSMLIEGDADRAEAEDQLLEIRLYTPPSLSGKEEDLESHNEALLSLPRTKSRSTLEPLCVFSDVKFLVPAGRFDLHIIKTMIKLHGKSNDFKIMYENIIEMYLLHGGSSPHVTLLLRLASPLRKGHTPYYNAVLQFDERKEIEIVLGGGEEEISNLKNSFKSSHVACDIKQNMSDHIYKIASCLLVALLKKDIITSETFKSFSGHPCFRCSYKAESGSFYPLEETFIFIHKPILILKYVDITSITLGRTVGAQTKLFEFDVHMKGGQTHSFSSVDRQESGPLLDFLKKKETITIQSSELGKAYERSETFLNEQLSEDDDSEDADQASSESGESKDDDEEDDNETNEVDSNESSLPDASVTREKKESRKKHLSSTTSKISMKTSKS